MWVENKWCRRFGHRWIFMDIKHVYCDRCGERVGWAWKSPPPRPEDPMPPMDTWQRP